MQQIFVYSDSLSWGIIPNTRRRLNFVERWPGAMEDQLIRAGRSTTSTVDGVHLDADQHLVLAHTLAQRVAGLLDAAPTEAR